VQWDLAGQQTRNQAVQWTSVRPPCRSASMSRPWRGRTPRRTEDVMIAKE